MLDIDPLVPLGPGGLPQPPGIARFLDILERQRPLGRYTSLVQHQRTTQIHQLRYMLYKQWAGPHAGVAGGAIPDDVLGDDILDETFTELLALALEYGRALLFGMLPQLHDDLLRRKRLIGVICRALVLASSALGAGVTVQQIFPGVLLHPRNPELLGLLVLQVEFGQPAVRFLVGEKDVGQRTENVHMLGYRHVVEHGQEEKHMHPPEDMRPDRQRSRGETPGQEGLRQVRSREGGRLERSLRRHVESVGQQVENHQTADQHQYYQRFQAHGHPFGPDYISLYQGDYDSHQHQQAEQVHQEQKRLMQRAAQYRKLESGPDPFTEKVQRGERDDHESPEDHKMRGAHDELIQQTPLAEHEFKQSSYPGADIVATLFGFKKP